MPPKKKPQKWTRNKIVRAAFMWCGLIVLSWVNATNFDKTEYKFLGQAAGMWILLQKALPD